MPWQMALKSQNYFLKSKQEILCLEKNRGRNRGQGVKGFDLQRFSLFKANQNTLQMESFCFYR